MLRDARKNLDLTIDEVALGSGLSKPTIINLERGFGRVQSGNAVCAFLSKIYFSRRPIEPVEKDRLIWASLFPHTPYPDGNPTRGPGRPRNEKKGNAWSSPTMETKSSQSQATAVSKVLEFSGAQALESGQTITAHSETSPFSRRESSQGGLSKEYLNNPLVIDCLAAAVDRYREINSIRPANRAALRELYQHVASQPWSARNGEKRSEPAVQKWIARTADIQVRERRKDTGAQRKRQAILEILRGPIAQRRSESHDKGAGEYAMGSLTAITKGVLRDPVILEKLTQHPAILGKVPSISNIVRLLSEYRGGADNHADVRDHLEKTIGFRAAWAGQVAVVDATGWPVRFRYGDNRENHKRWLYLLCDVASARLLAANRSATSESEGWRPQDNPERNDVMLGFLRELGFAPEWLVNDAVSTLTDGLRHLKLGMHPAEKISAGVLLWLAAGVRPYVRMGARPTGGAHVERAVHTTKDKLAELGTQRAIEKESKGCGLQRLNHCDNELEFLNQISTAIAEINETQLKRRGCPLGRNELYELNTGAVQREGRKLASDLFRANDEGLSKWWQIVGDCKLGQVSAGRVAVRINGKAWTAELETPESGWECRPEEKHALILPPGARHNDDPEAFRILVIETDGARVQYHPATARTIKVDEYYQETSKPLIGGFQKKPDTAADEFSRLRNTDAADYRKHLKTGTTDEPVSAQTIRDRY